MPKKSKAKCKSNDTKSTIPKSLGLFDHINHIRKVQSPDYYDTLTDADKKSFSHFMIVKGLSMDRSSIGYVAEIAKFYETVPSRNFYQLCVAVTQRTNVYFPYIKSKAPKLNKKLVECVLRRFSSSTKEAEEYCKILMRTESGTNELIDICKGYGLTESEVKDIMIYE